MSASLTIGVASDHAGFSYKTAVKEYLLQHGYTVCDFGTHSPESCDYPLFIRPLAKAIAAGEVDRGIIFGGSGNGEAIVANRVPGVRCGLCWNEEVAVWNRSHNDGNCLSIGERTISLDTTLRIVQIWLETAFEGGRHERRVRLIDAETSPES